MLIALDDDSGFNFFLKLYNVKVKCVLVFVHIGSESSISNDVNIKRRLLSSRSLNLSLIMCYNSNPAI